MRGFVFDYHCLNFIMYRSIPTKNSTIKISTLINILDFVTVVFKIISSTKLIIADIKKIRNPITCKIYSSRKSNRIMEIRKQIIENKKSGVSCSIFIF